MRIVLIGFRGTGKSVLGKEISKTLGLKYISTDIMIKNHYSLSVAAIVEKFGWQEFRSKEIEIIKEVSSLDDVVIDTGGGSILNENNRKMLKQNAVVIQLIASEESIIKRISEGKDRPNLTSQNSLQSEIHQLIEERKELYNSISDFIVDTSKNSFEGSKKIILDYIKGLV